MFFKKAKRKLWLIHGVPWDDKTTQWFAQAKRFEVMVTSINRTKTTGRRRHDADEHRPLSFEVAGLLTFPKFILVNITFDTDAQTFGGFCYNSLNVEVRGEELTLPLLEVWLAHEAMKEIYDAHRDALWSGRTHSTVGFWKQEGDGVMTALDREKGYSYQSRYPVFGIITWSELNSTSLPTWALPPSHEHFSLENLPEYLHDLRL
jgi:hypothetical protein